MKQTYLTQRNQQEPINQTTAVVKKVPNKEMFEKLMFQNIQREQQGLSELNQSLFKLEKL